MKYYYVIEGISKHIGPYFFNAISHDHAVETARILAHGRRVLSIFYIDEDNRVVDVFKQPATAIEERISIVKYLRQFADDYGRLMVCTLRPEEVIRTVAVNIENGDHTQCERKHNSETL